MPPGAPVVLVAWVLDARTAAKLLAISARTLSEISNRHELSFAQIGRGVLYDPADDARCTQTTDQTGESTMTTLTNAPDGRTVGTEPRPAVSAELLDVRAVASLLGGCSTRHVYRLADTGRMPRPIRLGTLVRWRRAEVMSWIDGGCQPIRPSKPTTR